MTSAAEALGLLYMGVAAGSNPPLEYQPILITGATGFVGMEVMARFLQRSQRHVFALIRAHNDADADQRLRVVLATAFGDPDAYPGRVTRSEERRVGKEGRS